MPDLYVVLELGESGQPSEPTGQLHTDRDDATGHARELNATNRELGRAERHRVFLVGPEVVCAQCQLGRGVDVPVGDPRCPHTEQWYAGMA
jgi:hypothetical protein